MKHDGRRLAIVGGIRGTYGIGPFARMTPCAGTPARRSTQERTEERCSEDQERLARVELSSSAFTRAAASTLADDRSGMALARDGQDLTAGAGSSSCIFQGD